MYTYSACVFMHMHVCVYFINNALSFKIECEIYFVIDFIVIQMSCIACHSYV